MAKHEVVIHENTGATKDQAPYLGSYIAKETVKEGVFVNSIAMLCGMSAVQVTAILDGTFEAIEELEREGLVRVHTDIGVVCGVITGSFPTSDAAFDKERNTLELALRIDEAIRFALTGTFQAENAQTVLTVVDALVAHAGFVLRDADVVKGLERVVWPGRCQKIVAEGVTVFVDGAHNPDGATALCRALKSVGVGAAKSVGLIAGYCGDKDVLAHLRVMRTCAAQSWATPIRNARSMASDATAACMREAGFTRATACASFADAWTQALAWAKAKNGTLVVCGSLFLAGEALVALNAFPWLVRAPDANESSLHPSS